MADKLTPQQAMAVENRGGTLLISAAAGSGKTKVLVDRLMMYLTDPVDPANLDEFLIITYTKAAASELRGKIASKLSERIAEDPNNRHLQQQMQRLFLAKISTVHAFCADLLRDNAYRLDISSDFRVGDENECRELRELAMTMVLDDAFQRIDTDDDLREFVDTQGLGRTDALIPEIILKVYDRARCHLDPNKWLMDCLEFGDMDGITDPGQTVWGKYLMDDLFAYLDLQSAALKRCAEALDTAVGMEKPAALLRDTLYQIKQLRGSETWDDLLRLKQIDFGRLLFPRKCSDPELAERVKAVRSACKKGLEKNLRNFADPSSQVIADLSSNSGSLRGMIDLVRRFALQYDALKNQRRILDFGDLEHRTLDLLRGKNRTGITAAAKEIGSRFREILVDEYQDSNGVQDAIFTALTHQRNNLFLVGDVKQSIYQFRLADPGIFLKKYAEFLPAEQAVPGESRKILLSNNFRSGGAVLNAVNDVFRACMSERVGGLEYGVGEALHEGIPHVPLGEPEVELHVVDIQGETYPEEAAFVAARIQALLDGTHMVRQGDTLRPITVDDVVILLRSPGSVGGYFQRALERRGIRCTSGGGSDLLQAPEIQVLRSLLQVIANPRQDIPLIAVLCSPVFGFSADDLARIRGMHRKTTFYDALLLDTNEKSVSFVHKLNDLRNETRIHSLAMLMEKIFTLTRMDSLYAAMPGGEARSANLQQFFQMTVSFDSGTGSDLGQFLAHLDALDEKGIPSGTKQTSGAVTIMSIHKSKGLEFPVVFLCGLSREFNRESLRAQVLCDRDLGIGMSCVDANHRIRYPSIAKRAVAVKTVKESLSEELRVLYVAMTRAKDRLIMTYASKNPETELADLSLRGDLCGKELMTGDVICPGRWVLYEAIHRMEAGALHNAGERPELLHASEFPWKICISEAPAVQEGDGNAIPVMSGLPSDALLKLAAGLRYQYPHTTATLMPSKLTATSLKGREKDQEAAENTPSKTVSFQSWRRPGFAKKEVDGKEHGTAVHTVLRYIRFDHCEKEDDIRQEIDRLVDKHLLKQAEADSVDPHKILIFFQTDIGKKIRTGKVLREFKFSILEDASQYHAGLEDEMVLLQGVVDCALLEPDGLTIVDFKTDRISTEGLGAAADRYRDQVHAYARAVSRIFDMKVKSACLYFFHLGQFVNV